MIVIIETNQSLKGEKYGCRFYGSGITVDFIGTVCSNQLFIYK